MFRKLWDGVCELIYPHNCTICKKYLSAYDSINCLCPTCESGVEFNKPPFCSYCSRYLEGNSKENLCRQCRRHSYHFDQAWATTFYNDTMKRLIHLFKYNNKTSLRRSFTQLICSFIQNYNLNLDIIHHDLITPIPLHPTRLRERGYNQSQLIVDNISKAYKIKMSRENLIRILNTKNQALLNQKDRWTNIKGAFKIRNPSEVYKKSVLIFDDLLTTGATVSEAARILKEAGAKKVNVLTLAIAY